MAITYIPNVGGSVIFLSIFSLLLIAQAWQLNRYRAWSYSFAMILGILLEIGGYIARIQLRFDPLNTGVMLVNLVFLTIGPIFFSLAIYLSASRIINFFDAHRFYPSLKWTIISLIFCSFLALAIEFVGGGIAGTASTAQVSGQGTKVMAVGLFLQVVMACSSAGLAIEFLQEVRRENQSNNGPVDIEVLRQSERVKRLAVALALATLFILIRSIFRGAELWCGGTGIPVEDEILFVILESAMTTLAAILLTVIHPGWAFSGAWTNSGWEWGRKVETIEGKEPSDTTSGIVPERDGLKR